MLSAVFSRYSSGRLCSMSLTGELMLVVVGIAVGKGFARQLDRRELVDLAGAGVCDEEFVEVIPAYGVEFEGVSFECAAVEADGEDDCGWSGVCVAEAVHLGVDAGDVFSGWIWGCVCGVDEKIDDGVWAVGGVEDDVCGGADAGVVGFDDGFDFNVEFGCVPGFAFEAGGIVLFEFVVECVFECGGIELWLGGVSCHCCGGWL